MSILLIYEIIKITAFRDWHWGIEERNYAKTGQVNEHFLKRKKKYGIMVRMIGWFFTLARRSSSTSPLDPGWVQVAARMTSQWRCHLGPRSCRSFRRREPTMQAPSVAGLCFRSVSKQKSSWRRSIKFTKSKSVCLV